MAERFTMLTLRGDHLESGDLDRVLDPLITGRVVTGYFADRLALARATLDLLEGEPLAAQRWIPNWRERLASGSERWREHLVLARMAAAMGETEILGDAPSAVWEATNALHRIEASKLRAALALSTGLEDRARTELATAMREALGCGAAPEDTDLESTPAAPRQRTPASYCCEIPRRVSAPAPWMTSPVVRFGAVSRPRQAGRSRAPARRRA